MPKKVYKASSKSDLKKKIGALIILLIALPLILLQVKVVQDLRNRAAPESLPPGVEKMVIDGRVFYTHQDSGEAFPEPDLAMQRSTPAIPCVGDGVSGPRFQVVYAYQKGTPNRIAEVEGQIRSLVGQASEIFDLSAQQTGGRRVPRFVTNNCELDIKTIVLPKIDWGTVSDAYGRLGIATMNRNALVFVEPSVADEACGSGTIVPDVQPGWRNRSNFGGATARIADSADSRCWSPYVVAHEMMHNLAAVSSASPNATTIHCVDEHDIMCYQDAQDIKIRYECPDEVLGEARFDCNGDDYYSFTPSGYLASNWNSAYSAFLDDPTRDTIVIKSGGSDKQGENVSLTVSGFQPNEAFGIAWRNGINKKDPWMEGSEMLEATADGNGTWSGSLTIPNNASANSKVVVRGSKGSYAEVAIKVKQTDKKKKKNKNNKKNNKKKKNKNGKN